VNAVPPFTPEGCVSKTSMAAVPALTVNELLVARMPGAVAFSW
jgi:hypothetical protein